MGASRTHAVLPQPTAVRKRAQHDYKNFKPSTSKQRPTATPRRSIPANLQGPAFDLLGPHVFGRAPDPFTCGRGKRERGAALAGHRLNTLKMCGEPLPNPFCDGDAAAGREQWSMWLECIEDAFDYVQDVGLSPQTAGLAMSFFAHYLKQTTTAELAYKDKGRLKTLLGASTLLASKLVESKTPALDDLCRELQTSKAKVKKLEVDLLCVLSPSIGFHPICHTPYVALGEILAYLGLADEAGRCEELVEHSEILVSASYRDVRRAAAPTARPRHCAPVHPWRPSPAHARRRQRAAV